MALGKVKVQRGWGSARRDRKDKRVRVQAFCVHVGVHGMEDGIPPKGLGVVAAMGLRFFLKRSPMAIRCALGASKWDQ